MEDVDVIKLIDEKIGACNKNCDNKDKLDKTTFYWVMGIFIGLFSSLVGVLYGQIQTVKETSSVSITEMKISLAKIETTTESIAKQTAQLQAIFATYDLKINK